MKKYLALTAALFLLGETSSANPRCNNFEGAACETIRTQAVQVGCLQPAQLAIYRMVNLVPMCVGATLVNNCTCGCFAPEVRIGVEGGELSAREIFEGKNTSLVVVKPGKKNEMASDEVAQKTIGSEERPLVRLTLDNGRVLRLTERHPVYTSDEKMKTARELTKSDRLVDADGKQVRLEKIEREDYRGYVYNFSAKGKEHVILAEGVLVGDLTWQKLLEEENEALAIRH